MSLDENLKKAEIAYKEGKYKEAINLVKPIFLSNINSTELLEFLLNSYGALLNESLESGKLEEALYVYNELLGLRGEHPGMLFGKAGVLMAMNKYVEALNVIDKGLKLDSKNVEGLTIKGIALSKLGEFDKALRYLDEALKIDPKYELALANKKRMLLKRTLSAIPPTDKNYQKAKSAFDKGKIRKAIEYAKKAYQNSKDNDAAFKRLCDYSMAMIERTTKFLGTPEDCIFAADTLIDLTGGDDFLFFVKASQLMELNKFKDAIEWIEKTIELNTKHLDALVAKGICNLKLENYNEALESVEKALEIDPEYKGALKYKYEILLKLGREKEAKKIYSKYL
ncbi:MAG: tetratricopeptide repeat protein [Candidatus Thorarchaeota archaeon]